MATTSLSHSAPMTMAQRRKLKADEKKQKLTWQTAVYDASMQEGHLRIAWTSAGVVDPIIYDFRETFGIPLISVRLIGVELETLPDEFCPRLRSLEILVLENNKLSQLPDNLDALTSLRELSLANNQLRGLSERIGFLGALTKITLNNNALVTLPSTFGALAYIERLDLECNELTVLPENLDNLTLCRSLNLNRNRLTRLPRCIGRMPSLTQLSACCNQIAYIPLDLCSSRTLTLLRLSQNGIKVVPERVGELAQLKELCLDYNQIGRLPLSFHRLHKLQVLRLDGNASLLDPPPEVLAEGARRVVKYFHDLFYLDKQGRMRHIILATQSMLSQAAERGLYNKALFEPDVVLPAASAAARGDLWFATHPRFLFDELVPAMRKVWEGVLLAHPTGVPSDMVTAFSFSEQEVLWAWSSYSDACGPVLQQATVKFRRCACLKPCVPPEVGFMCSRTAFCFKKQLTRLRDKQERVWLAYKQAGEADAVRRAEVEAQAYIKSHEGKDWLESTAYEQAEEILLDSGVDRVVQRRLDRAEAKKKKVVAKFDAKKNLLLRARDKKAKVLQDELAQLKEARKLAPEGYMRDVLEQKITQAAQKLASLPESLALQQVARQCELEVQRVDDNLYTSSESDSFESAESSPFDSDDSDEEAVRWRRRRERHQEKRRDAAQLKALEDDFARLTGGRGVESAARAREQRRERRADEIPTVLEGVTEDLQRVGRAVGSFVRPMAAYTQRSAHRKLKRVRRLARDIVEVNRIRAMKLARKLSGGFDEVQRQLKEELARQYVHHQVELARDKSRHEFAVIERVRESMHGTSKERSFLTWKRWVWEKQRRLRRDARKRLRLATKGFVVAVESVRSAQAQVEMWRRQVDVYSDAVFFQHATSGAVTFDEPGLQHYLPPNFSIPPPPPEDALDDGDLGGSSDSSEGSVDLNEWQRKYGQDRQALQAQLQEEEQARLVRLGPRATNRPPPPPDSQPPPSADPQAQLVAEQRRIYALHAPLPPPAGSAVVETFGEAFERAVAWARDILRSPVYAQVAGLVEEKTDGLRHPMPQQLPAPDHEGSVLSSLDGASEDLVVFDGDAMHVGAANTLALHRDNLVEVGEQVRERSRDEWERAYKAIRRVRNADNATRRDLYLAQATRKPRAHEQSTAVHDLPSAAQSARALEAAARPQRGERDGAFSALAPQVKGPLVANPLRPSTAELLRLAGGDLDMVHTGKEGFELRTVLAQRAVALEKKLREQHVQRHPHLGGRHKKNLLQRELLPLFQHRVESSSDSEDEAEARRRDRAERKKGRREDRELQRKIERVEGAMADAADPMGIASRQRSRRV